MDEHDYSRVASSPGSALKIGKGTWLHLQTMCWVSILCNTLHDLVVASFCSQWHNNRVGEQILLWSNHRQILWGKSRSLASVNTLSKFLKFKVYKKSASFVPIFTCQEYSNWRWTNMILLLQAKTVDTVHTRFMQVWPSPFPQFLGGAWGHSYCQWRRGGGRTSSRVSDDC